MRGFRGWLIAAGVMALSLVAGLACPGNIDPVFLESGPGGGGGSPPPECDALALMRLKCGAAGCHDAPGNTNYAGLDLLSPDPASRLVGFASSGENGAKCGAGVVYLEPGSAPAKGLFVDKLTDPTCGDQMPVLVTWDDANDPVPPQLGNQRDGAVAVAPRPFDSAARGAGSPARRPQQGRKIADNRSCLGDSRECESPRGRRPEERSSWHLSLLQRPDGGVVVQGV